MPEAGDTTSIGRKSFGELIADIPRLLAELVRAELEALKQELTRAAVRAGIGVGLLAGALLLVALALVALVVAAIAALSLVLPVWAAALIVAGGLILIAALLGLLGVLRLRSAGPDLEARRASIAEDLRAIRGEAPRATPEGERNA